MTLVQLRMGCLDFLAVRPHAEAFGNLVGNYLNASGVTRRELALHLKLELKKDPTFSVSPSTVGRWINLNTVPSLRTQQLVVQYINKCCRLGCGR